MALELGVVFIGVYGAYALQEHEEKRDAQQRRRQLELALVQEIEDVTTRTRRVAEVMPRMVSTFDSLEAAGARPPLVPMMEPVRVETHMWEATLQSDGIDLFAVPTVYRLSLFYNRLNAGFEQMAQLRALSETALLPNLGRGPDAFYDPASGRLRPEYRWYRDGIERLGALAAEITVLGDSAAAELRDRPD